MRAVIQRVSEAQVTVAGRTIGKIGDGLLILLGVAVGDSERDLRYLVEKTIHLRIFDDENGKWIRCVDLLPVLLPASYLIHSSDISYCISSRCGHLYWKAEPYTSTHCLQPSAGMSHTSPYHQS